MNSSLSLSLDTLSWAQTVAGAAGPFSGTSSFAVDAWIRFDGLPEGTIIIGQEGVFAFGSQAKGLYFEFDGSQQIVTQDSTSRLRDDAWHYVCVTFDGAMIYLYIDGLLNTSQSCMPSVTANTNSVQLGNYLQGLLLQMRIYNGSQTAEQVLQNMYNAPPAASLVANFDFTVNPPIDSGPQSYQISLQGNAAMVQVTPALALGAHGFARPMGDEAINPGGQRVDPYTVLAWVFCTSQQPAAQAVFVNSDLMLDTGMALLLEYNATKSALCLVSQRGAGTGNGQRIVSSGTIPLNKWINVATTFDGTTLSLYINGVFDSSISSPPIPLTRLESDLLIGAAIEDGVPTGVKTLQGYIGEIDVWNVALHAAQIASYAHSSPSAGDTGLTAQYAFDIFPFRNQAMGTPVALAEGAEFGTQYGSVDGPMAAASWTSRAEAIPGVLPSLPDGIPTTPDASVAFVELERVFEASMAEDAEAFDSDADKRAIRSAWEALMASKGKAPPFMLTQHIVGDEHLLVVHQHGRAHVAFRVGALEMSACDVWRIGLVFTLVAGVLGVLTGVSCTLSSRGSAIIRTLLADARIGSSIARGTRITATGIFGTLRRIYELGALSNLIYALVDVGWWALFRLLARVIGVFTGIGTAQVVAGLVVLVASFAAFYKSKPKSCQSLSLLQLVNIGFDYDPTAASVEGLTLRKNATSDINCPEWVKGKVRAADSPCCYAISAIAGQTVTLQATFLCLPIANAGIQVRANNGGILGRIDPFTVDFAGMERATVTINLSHQTLAANGVQVRDVQWDWEYQDGSGNWVSLDHSYHRVYVTLDPPVAPWVQGGDRRTQLQLPWTSVLDYACTWAAGQTTSAGVLEKICAKVNASLGLAYETVSGATRYTKRNGPDPRLFYFQCTQFLEYLGNGRGNGNLVNCQDCAAIMTSFANALGCNVFANKIGNSSRRGYGFDINQVVLVGSGTTWSPADYFSYHEVAATGVGGAADPMYDACLQYDSGTDPWGAGPHTAALPVNVPFTTLTSPPILPLATPFTAASFRERLARNNGDGIGSCQIIAQDTNTSGGRRPAV